MWVEAINAKFKGIGKPYGKPEWDALLGHCQAATDTPCVIFYKELLLAYPDAKVILTERDDADQWFRSQMSTVIPYASRMIPQTLLEKFKALFSPLDSKAVALLKAILEDTPVYSALWHDYHHGTETAKQVYVDYNAEIRRLVPEKNLLVFNVKEGWGPLCEFLGEELPDEAFPRRNDKVAFARNNDQFGELVSASSQRNMLLAGAGLAAVVATLVFAVRLR